MWLIMAVLSALFAGLTAILAKCGTKSMDSDVITALRTAVVLVFSWIMVFLTGSLHTITDIGMRSLFFLILSGFATGASWLCYFKALSLGDVNKVTPVDKSSTVITVLLAIVIFQETSHLLLKLTGTAVLAVGIYRMIEKKRLYQTCITAKTADGPFMPFCLRSLPHSPQSSPKSGSQESNPISLQRSVPPSYL